MFYSFDIHIQAQGQTKLNLTKCEKVLVFCLPFFKVSQKQKFDNLCFNHSHIRNCSNYYRLSMSLKIGRVFVFFLRLYLHRKMIYIFAFISNKINGRKRTCIIELCKSKYYLFLPFLLTVLFNGIKVFPFYRLFLVVTLNCSRQLLRHNSQIHTKNFG